MSVIILGGSGLIGRALAASLATDGYDVVILSRNPQRVPALPSGIRAEQWDGCSAEGWGFLANGAEAIVNLAGENLAAGRWAAERKRQILASRLNPGQAVVQAVQTTTRKPAVLIQASAVGYYGPRGDQELAEDAPPGQDFAAQVVREWEASTAPVEALGVRRVLIRSGVVLSAKGGALPRMLMPFRLFAGGRLGSGRQWLSWIHIADEVDAIRFLIQNRAARGVFNLTAPNPVMNAEFSRIVGRILGRPAWLPTPALALRLVFGEMATVLLDGQRAIPQHLLHMGFAFRFPGLEAALRNLLGVTKPG